MLADNIISDLSVLEDNARTCTAQILSRRGCDDALWSVNLVDVYVCPRTKKVSHTFQIAYCSTTSAVGRSKADSLRYSTNVHTLPVRYAVRPTCTIRDMTTSMCLS
jgi:hypothetical protein